MGLNPPTLGTEKTGSRYWGKNSILQRRQVEFRQRES
jgi:hypothetical protein